MKIENSNTRVIKKLKDYNSPFKESYSRKFQLRGKIY